MVPICCASFAKKERNKMTNYEYDIITIGVGPAGLVVSAMGSEMGLKVCSIEKDTQ